MLGTSIGRGGADILSGMAHFHIPLHVHETLTVLSLARQTSVKKKPLILNLIYEER